jgi:hypothetical protein
MARGSYLATIARRARSAEPTLAPPRIPMRGWTGAWPGELSELPAGPAVDAPGLGAGALPPAAVGDRGVPPAPSRLPLPGVVSADGEGVSQASSRTVTVQGVEGRRDPPLPRAPSRSLGPDPEAPVPSHVGGQRPELRSAESSFARVPDGEAEVEIEAGPRLSPPARPREIAVPTPQDARERPVLTLREPHATAPSLRDAREPSAPPVVRDAREPSATAARTAPPSLAQNALAPVTILPELPVRAPARDAGVHDGRSVAMSPTPDRGSALAPSAPDAAPPARPAPVGGAVERRNAGPEPLRPVLRAPDHDGGAETPPNPPGFRAGRLGSDRSPARLEAAAPFHAGAASGSKPRAPAEPPPSLATALEAAFSWVSPKPREQAKPPEQAPPRELRAPSPPRAAEPARDLAAAAGPERAPLPPAPPREPRAIHIGSIDVRIQPPAAERAPLPPEPPRSPSAPPAGPARLARGFTTPLGLRQG